MWFSIECSRAPAAPAVHGAPEDLGVCGGFAVTKFLVLYKSSATAAEQMAAGDPAAAQEAMGLWMAWMEKAGPAIVGGGRPLGGPAVLPPDGGQGDRQIGGEWEP